MICSYCGADNNENRKICKGCGRPLYEEYDTYEEYGELPPQKKNFLLWGCIGAGTVAVLAIFAAGLLLFHSTTVSKKYTAKLSQAEKYVAQLDYDAAITLYNEAIKLEPDNADAYVKLVNVYISMNNLTKAQEIAMQGFDKTKNAALQDLVNRLFGTGEGSAETEIAVDTVFLTQMISKKYSELIQTYGAGMVSQENGYTKLNFADLKGALYYNSTSIDANTGRPVENAIPEYIILNDMKLLVKNFNGYLSEQTLSELFKNTIQIGMVDSVHCATMEYLNSRISIQCDSQGNVTTAAAYIKIVPLGETYDSDLNSLKGDAAGTITDAVKKTGLAGVHILARTGFNVKNGAVVAETDTDAKGNYTLNLSEGKYTLCVSKTGYEDQYFNITVNKGMTMSGQNYAMTGNSDAGSGNDIKLTLEWGNSPQDLDLHIQGQTETGTFISIFGYGGYSMSKSENGQVVAQLDKNENSGNGTETIAIKGTAVTGRYAVHIHDQTNRTSYTATDLSNSGAVLKVYLAGESTPHIYNVPVNVAATCWYPCNIINGKLTVPSASEQMVHSTIG